MMSQAERLSEMDLRTVSGAFGEPVLGSQAVFRSALSAFSRPGRIQTVTSDAQNPPGTGAAAAALLLTLLDPDCTLWLAPRLACGPANAWLRFHTGCRIVADPAAARFAWSDADQLPSLSRFALGSEFEPELSCTCVVEVQALEQQHGWRLRGPGIQDRHHLAVTGLAAGFFAEWQANHALFPRGVDLLLCAGQQVAALARTTELEA